MNSCPNCRIGRLAEVSLTFCRIFNESVLIAPFAPANKCTVCQFVTYDFEFLQAISEMVAPKKEQTPHPPHTSNKWQIPHRFIHSDGGKMI